MFSKFRPLFKKFAPFGVGLSLALRCRVQGVETVNSLDDEKPTCTHQSQLRSRKEFCSAFRELKKAAERIQFRKLEDLFPRVNGLNDYPSLNPYIYKIHKPQDPNAPVHWWVGTMHQLSTPEAYMMYEMYLLGSLPDELVDCCLFSERNGLMSPKIFSEAGYEKTEWQPPPCTLDDHLIAIFLNYGCDEEVGRLDEPESDNIRKLMIDMQKYMMLMLTCDRDMEMMLSNPFQDISAIIYQISLTEYLYLNGDLNLMMSFDEMSNDHLQDKFVSQKSLTVTREEIWIERLKSATQNLMGRSVVLITGSAHMRPFDKSGFHALLEKDGWMITRVSKAADENSKEFCYFKEKFESLEGVKFSPSNAVLYRMFSLAKGDEKLKARFDAKWKEKFEERGL